MTALIVASLAAHQILMSNSLGYQTRGYVNSFAVSRHIIYGEWEAAKGEFDLGGGKWSNGAETRDVLSYLCAHLENSYWYANAYTGIKWCVDRKADVNAFNGQPLWTAARNDGWQIALVRLLEYGAKPNLSPYFISSRYEIDKTYTLIRTNSSSILMASIEGKKSKNIAILLKHQADPNRLSKFSPNWQTPSPSLHTPLGMAAKQGLHDAIPILVKHGAKVDAKEPKTGYTALHHAVLAKQAKCISALLKARSNRNLKDAKGQTPLALARKLKFPDGIRLLSQ